MSRLLPPKHCLHPSDSLPNQPYRSLGLSRSSMLSSTLHTHTERGVYRCTHVCLYTSRHTHVYVPLSHFNTPQLWLGGCQICYLVSVLSNVARDCHGGRGGTPCRRDSGGKDKASSRSDILSPLNLYLRYVPATLGSDGGSQHGDLGHLRAETSGCGMQNTQKAELFVSWHKDSRGSGQNKPVTELQTKPSF